MVNRKMQKYAVEKLKNETAGISAPNPPKKPLPPKCTKHPNPIYMELLHLFEQKQTTYEYVTENVNYWRGKQPLADFPIDASQEYIIEHGEKYRQALLEFHEFAYNFKKEHVELSCYEGFSYLTQVNYYKEKFPKVFKGLQQKFLEELAIKGPCYTHTIISPCPEETSSFIEFLKAYRAEEVDVVLVGQDSSTILRNPYPDEPSVPKVVI